jgi:hypothetical protein
VKSRYNLAMSPDAQKTLDEARQLPPDERDWLAEQLLIQQNEEAFAAQAAEFGEPEPGYDEWFRAGVEEALADTSPDIPHEQVMAEMRQWIRQAKEDKNRATILS